MFSVVTIEKITFSDVFLKTFQEANKKPSIRPLEKKTLHSAIGYDCLEHFLKQNGTPQLRCVETAHTKRSTDQLQSDARLDHLLEPPKC